MRLLLVALFSVSLVLAPNKARALSNPCDDLNSLTVALVVAAAGAGSISGKISSVIDEVNKICDEIEIVLGGMQEMQAMSTMSRSSLGGIEKRVVANVDRRAHGEILKKYQVIREDIYSAGQAANRQLASAYEKIAQMQAIGESATDRTSAEARIRSLMGGVEGDIDDASRELSNMSKRIDLVRRDLCEDYIGGPRGGADRDEYDNLARECR